MRKTKKTQGWRGGRGETNYISEKCQRGKVGEGRGEVSIPTKSKATRPVARRIPINNHIDQHVQCSLRPVRPSVPPPLTRDCARPSTRRRLHLQGTRRTSEHLPRPRAKAYPPSRRRLAAAASPPGTPLGRRRQRAIAPPTTTWLARPVACSLTSRERERRRLCAE